MNLKSIIVAVMLVMSFTAFSQNQIAKTEKGESVILYSDGTWKYAKDVFKEFSESTSEVDSSSNLSKTNAQNSADICNEYVERVKDKMTGQTIITGKFFIVSDDMGKTGFGIGTGVVQSSNSIYLRIKPYGASSCIEKDALILILFDDGSKLTLKNEYDFNCDRDVVVYFGGFSGKKRIFDELTTKKIETLRVWTSGGYVQKDFSEENQTTLLNSFRCLQKYMK